MAMSGLDALDQGLVAALKRDARASITQLSADLGVTRATVQARLDRLRAGGVIRKFTIELNTQAEGDTVRAIMLIELQGNLARQITRALRRKPEITDLHSTNGSWDLVAEIEVDTLIDFDRVLREVRELSGVLNSETCLLLNKA